MASGAPHWVEELFPPAFGLTLNEILKDDSIFRTDDDDHTQKGDITKRPKEQSVFSKVAQKISPLDTNAIKNVYERVWLMEYLEQKEKEGDGTFALTSSPHGTIQLKHRGGSKQDAETSTTDINKQIDLQDSCLWKSQEIDVLRTVFKAASSQNNELRASLTATQQELEILKSKHKAQSKMLESRTDHLNEAKKANERLKILCDSLKAQNKDVEKKLLSIDKESQRYVREIKDQVKKIQELQKEADIERLMREEVETKLALQSQEALREQILYEENMKSLHEEDIKYMNKKVTELQEQLKQEKKDHERTKKGLDHLRTHFASLPLSQNSTASNAVTNDQLKQWTYR